MSNSTQTAAAIHRSEVQPGIVELTFDMPGKSANVLTEDMFDQLDGHLQELMSSPEGIRGLILKSAKPKIFFAGADLNLISSSLDWPDERIRQFCRDGQRIFGQLGQLPFPSVAAIHGVCVGGGLELTLACDFRICTDARNTWLGLPEVNLGLIPGWCGTVRTPRLIGFPEAIELVISGRLVNADEADSLLLVDDVVPQEKLESACIELIENCTEQQLMKRRKLMDSPIVPSVIQAHPIEFWQKQIEANPKIHDFAPSVAAEHMVRSASMKLDEAGESEAEAMSRVWGSDSSHGLINLFFTEERIKKAPGIPRSEIALLPIKSVGVLGAGQMGAQIARAFAANHFNIVIFDANPDVGDGLVESLSNNKSMIRSAKKLGGLAKCDLVIESIVENAQVKRDVMARLEEFVSAETIIATNTSSLPVSELKSVMKNPSRLVGTHFCQPFDDRKLCELIPCTETDDRTMLTTARVIRQIGKSPLVVGDSPAFVVNRMLAPFMDQALNLVALGIDPQAIEESALEFGFEMGPLELADSIGIDTLFYAGLLTLERLPNLITQSKILPRLIKARRLGKKIGLGVFDYSSGERRPDPVFSTVIADAMIEPRIESISDEQIQMNLIAPMLVEAFKLIQENVVRDARDIDFCTVHGAGFPAHKGGLLFWADQIGSQSLLREIDKVAKFRPVMLIPDELREFATANRKFHE